MARFIAHAVSLLLIVVGILLAVLAGVPASIAVETDAAGTPRGQALAQLLVLFGIGDGRVTDPLAGWVARGMIIAAVVVFVVAYLVERRAVPRPPRT